MKKLFTLLGWALLGFVVALFLFPARDVILGAFQAFNSTAQLMIKLVVIALFTIMVASLLSPLEALGWWAGWYGDSVDKSQTPGTLQTPIAPDTKISRYVIYLDGIGQADFTYLPEGEAFLNQLAAALPPHIAIIRGLMPYSVLNRSLTSDRKFAWFWRLADQTRSKKPGSLLGFIINVRNMLTVSVSADLRYGPIFNLGIAQVMYNSLISHGYQLGSGTPVTLVGFSGGGQISMGSAPMLKEALNAPIDVISLGGVFCGRNNSLKLEHIYHLAGEKDNVQRIGAIIFPRRWKAMFLSYWNRSKQNGLVSLISLGPIGHENPGGVMDAQAILPDGRTNMEQTVDWVSGILTGTLPPPEMLPPRAISNYERYQTAAFNHPDYYPIAQSLPADCYRPMATWMGRLILPTIEQRQQVKGVWFEVYHAAAGYEHLVGQVVRLCWQSDPRLQAAMRSVTRNLHFNDDARLSLKRGVIHPERLNDWRLVDPLESLAGARPNDDMIVRLTGEVVVEPPQADAAIDYPSLAIREAPTEISACYYALVQFIKALETSEAGQLYQVRHFNSTTGEFDGVEESVWLPQVVADENDTYPSTSRDLERSPCNLDGWYIYGAQNQTGRFVVQSIMPRRLFRLQPNREIRGKKAGMEYLKRESWENLVAQKGTVSSVLLLSQGESPAPYQEGDRLLVVHIYGGIGGNKREPAARGPVYFGHFTYGIAEVVREPITRELIFDIVYYQVYTHNGSGLLSCRQHWTRYMGDRQWGFLGIRPVCDLLIQLDSFTGYYTAGDIKESPLDVLKLQLDLMTARYRIGDGTGATYVGPANNCAQDSNQALYAALRQMVESSKTKAEMGELLQQRPDIGNKLEQLERLGYSLKRDLLPFGIARADWKENRLTLGSSMQDSPFKQLMTGLGSWRTMLPRVASNAVARTFLREDAVIWVLRTNQVGGEDPDIEPIAPMQL